MAIKCRWLALMQSAAGSPNTHSLVAAAMINSWLESNYSSYSSARGRCYRLTSWPGKSNQFASWCLAYSPNCCPKLVWSMGYVSFQIQEQRLSRLSFGDQKVVDDSFESGAFDSFLAGNSADLLSSVFVAIFLHQSKVKFKYWVAVSVFAK